MEVFQVCKYIVFSVATSTTAPEIHLQFLANDTCRVKINFITTVVKLGGGVVWPGKVSVDEHGYIRCRLDKVKKGNWTNILQPITDNSNYSTNIPERWNTTVVVKRQLTHDICLLTIHHDDMVYNHIGVGRHISVFRKIGNFMKFYDYTPVPLLPLKRLDYPNRVPGNWFPMRKRIHLLVKAYPNGTISRWLCDREVGDTITVSNPKGTFDPGLLNGMKKVILFAGGTGITPILSLVVWLLQTKRNVTIDLYFVNKEERDIPWKAEIEQMSEEHENFRPVFILTKPHQEWRGLKGRINFFMLTAFVKPYWPGKTSTTFFGICGRTLFTIQIARNLTKVFGYPQKQVYQFVGQ